MPRKKTIPTEPLPDPPAEITEAMAEPVAAPIEQPPPDILAGSAPPGEDLEIPSVPSETDAKAEVVSTEASEDAEEPSADDADMTVDFVEDSVSQEDSPPDPEPTAEVEEAVLEEDKGKMTVRFWKPVMKKGGIIEFIRPEECTQKRHIREMERKVFGKDNFTGLKEFTDEEVGE